MGKRRAVAWCALAVALSGCPQQKDCWITGMSPVQGVQTTLNQVPLVAYKPTFVRVYVQSNEANHGPWTDVTARLTVKDLATGTTDELRPTNTFNQDFTIAVNPNGSQLDHWGDSFTFWLNYEDTTPGQKEMTATISSVSNGFSSGTASDHVWQISPTFYPRQTVRVYGVVWAASDNNDGITVVGPAAPWSNYYGHYRYVENVFPVTTFSIIPLPGVGEAPPNPQPFTNSTGARAWADQQLANLPANSKINLLLNWSGLNGYAAGSRSEEENIRTEGIGTTMAQEVSHTFGMWCHTFDACDHYPHPDTSEIGSVDIGFDLAEDTTTSAVLLVAVTGLRDVVDHVIDGNRVTDFMSYAQPPNWISSYTACQSVGVLWSNPAPCNSVASAPRLHGGPALAGLAPFALPAKAVPATPATSPIAVVAPAASGGRGHLFLYVAGTLKGDTATFDPFQMITSRQDHATRLEGENYALTLEDKAGKALKQFRFTPRTSGAKRSEANPSTHFSLVIPFDDFKDTTAAVVLRRDDKILATRKAAPHYPKIALAAAPKSEEAVNGLRTISWTATDPDKNPLVFGSDYSADAGETWVPLHVGLNKPSLAVNFDNVPGSDHALLRVWASNGLKTSEARSPATFRVPRKPPRVAITLPLDGAKLAKGQPLIARASGYSLEDGVLVDGAAYSWSSDRDGSLGTGAWIVLRKLSPGAHALTLTARDSVGKTATATVKVTVTEPDRKP